MLFIDMKETWFNERIQKVVDLEQYETFWVDRVNIKQGGVAIYAHSKFEGKHLMKMSWEVWTSCDEHFSLKLSKHKYIQTT